ncbi:hypothetical protein EJC51_09145 [Streptomyces aquilus]|uniref:Tetratricopeptide repeat protein n=1 Tax=Streptomyces aquilus TaxID=2548456 RepID=A0A3S9HVY7_9ACTN|nr:hypothetical protein [Streptomyces aquilus]AZP16265.1 hypothetical protein EJC51_09145 [Streptomyces aquilus]
MNHSEKVDQDAVLRARTMLLESGRPSTARQVEAYRVLSAVSPLTYVPKLAEALVSYGYEPDVRDLPEARLARHAEAAAVARRIDEGDPRRTELLVRALDSCQHGLYALGRRAEGFAVCEEMAAAGRWGFEHGQVRSPAYGHGRLAAVLAEEGRYGEAAAICGKAVEAERPLTPGDNSFWSVVKWVAALEAAGWRETALDAFTELVDVTRAEVATDSTALAIQVWQLVHLGRMLTTAGRQAEAVVVRQEALGLLTELDLTGERKSWSNILSWWITLFALSGRPAEPVPTAQAPGPGFGAPYLDWSPDVRDAYFEGLGALEDRVAALREDASTPLPELIAQHRRLVVRAAVHRERRHHRILKPLRPLFTASVALARRLAQPGVLGEALTDRAMFFVAAKQYGEAYDDFREACQLLDG